MLIYERTIYLISYSHHNKTQTTQNFPLHFTWNFHQPSCDLLSEEEKQESIHIEGFSPEGEKIINQAPEGDIYTK